MWFILLLLLPGVRSQEVTSPRSQLAFNAVQFVQHKNAKNGPILFPNDAPPPPPTPLIVTSRPLSESIAKSELNPNNTLTAQSQFHQVSFKPEYLARNKNYKPFTYTLATVTPVYDYGLSKLGYGGNPGSVGSQRRENFYNDYEKRLMESIHPTRERIPRRKVNAWDHPVRGRRYEQVYEQDNNARKSLHDNEVKSKQIKVFHSSLYSREANYDNEDSDDHHYHRGVEHDLDAFIDNDKDDMVKVVKTGRRAYEEDKRRREIPYRRPQYPHYHHNRRNMKSREHPYVDRDIRVRPMRDPDKIKTYVRDDRNNRNNHIYRTRSPNEYRNHILRRTQWYSHEQLSRHNVKHGGIRRFPTFPTRTTPNKYVRNYRRMHSYHAQPLRIRPVLSIENTGYEKPKQRDTMYHMRGSKENYEISPKRSVWQKLSDIDNEETYIRKIPHNPEHQSASIEKLGDLSTRNPMQSVEHLGNFLTHRKPKNPDTVETITPSISEVFKETNGYSGTMQKRPVHNPDSGGMPQQRVVQPLYEVTDNGHQDRYTPPQANNKYRNYNSKPNYQHRPEDNYYPTNEGEHENSKEFNQGENYAFSYTVKDHKTGDDFSHSQQSTGSATNGQYRVRLPDGRMQIVSYIADENGYKADVRYDDQHNQDNSIDVDISKENQYKTNHLPTTYKHNNVPYNDHTLDQDSFENDEFIRQHMHNNKGLHLPGPTKRPIAYNNNRPLNDVYSNHDRDFDNINDYANKNDYQPYNNNYQTKSAYVDTTKVNIHDHGSGGLTDNNNEYLEHYNEKFIESNDKVQRTKDDDYFKFSDEIPFSKEVMDYSSELNDPYQPHKSKYSDFAHNQGAKTKVVPSYDELKNLFVTNPSGRRNSPVPVIVTTARPNYDVTPVDVVEITPKKPNLYTNIKNIVPVTPTPYVFSTVSPTTPRSFLLSTIANLKHQINLADKPVLSHQYINKINKYLTYK